MVFRGRIFDVAYDTSMATPIPQDDHDGDAVQRSRAPEHPSTTEQHVRALIAAQDEAQGFWEARIRSVFPGVLRRAGNRTALNPQGHEYTALEPEGAGDLPRTRPAQARYAGAGILTVTGAAQRLGISVGSCRAQFAEGRIPGAFKAGNQWRIKESDVDAFQASGGNARPRRGSVDHASPSPMWDGTGPTF